MNLKVKTKKLLKNPAILVLSCIALGSCSKSDDANQASFTKMRFGTPKLLSYDDTITSGAEYRSIRPFWEQSTENSSESSLSVLSPFSGRYFIDGEIKSVSSHDITPSSNLKIREEMDPAVRQVYYGQKQHGKITLVRDGTVTTHEGTYPSYKLEGEIIEDNEPAPLIFRRSDNSSYASDSVRGAALMTAMVLENMKHALGLVYSDAGSLKPVDLHVDPILTTTIVVPDQEIELTQSMTDNAAFVAGEDAHLFSEQSRNHPMIIMFPQSEEITEKQVQGKLLLLGHRMSSVPAIPAHEYGHHVFETFLGHKIEARVPGLGHSLTDYKTQGHFSFKASDESRQTIGFSLTQKPRQINQKVKISESTKAQSRSSLYVSIHEAFADLFSNYAMELTWHGLFNKSFEFLEGAHCLDYSRNPVSDIWGDWSPKMIDGRFFQAFYQPSEDHSNVSGCLAPKANDPHALGAALAHIMSSIYEAAEYEADDRLANLMKWLDVVYYSDFITLLKDDKYEAAYAELIREFIKPFQKNKVIRKEGGVLVADEEDDGTNDITVVPRSEEEVIKILNSEICEIVAEKAPYLAELIVTNENFIDGTCQVRTDKKRNEYVPLPL